MPKKNRSPINLVEIATSLARQQALWGPLVSYDPVARYYVRLAREHEFEAWLLTWLPGQGTAGTIMVAVLAHSSPCVACSPSATPRLAMALRESFGEIESWWRERCAPLVRGTFMRSPTAERNLR
jgi:hypothetical protein